MMARKMFMMCDDDDPCPRWATAWLFPSLWCGSILESWSVSSSSIFLSSSSLSLTSKQCYLVIIVLSSSYKIFEKNSKIVFYDFSWTSETKYYLGVQMIDICQDIVQPFHATGIIQPSPDIICSSVVSMTGFLPVRKIFEFDPVVRYRPPKKSIWW